jgi:hypothetical protein
MFDDSAQLTAHSSQIKRKAYTTDELQIAVHHHHIAPSTRRDFPEVVIIVAIQVLGHIGVLRKDATKLTRTVR